LTPILTGLALSSATQIHSAITTAGTSRIKSRIIKAVLRFFFGGAATTVGVSTFSDVSTVSGVSAI
jgi:hypothetical protein